MPSQHNMTGRTIALAGDTGSGKTTLLGEKAKADFRQTRKPSFLAAADDGGYESIKPLIKVGVVVVEDLPPGTDPFTWIGDINKRQGQKWAGAFANVFFDSATNLGAKQLDFVAKSNQQIGQQKTQKFTITQGNVVGLNNEAHFGLVQGFLRDHMWRSTWFTREGVDVVWTFALDRGEKADDTPTLGPKLVGKALTSIIPSWFNYFFRTVSIPVKDAPARHLLYIQEQPEIGGLGMSFGNARYPLDAVTPLPAVIEPASLVEALRLIEAGQQEAEEALRIELALA